MSGVLLLDTEISADRYEIRLSGSGGQGMMLAAMLLCETIGADPHLNLVQTKSYGPEARGGASKADIVVSPNEIYYPKPINLDLLLAMTQESCDKYFADLRKGGILIIDETLVTHPPSDLHFALPLTQLAREELHNPMVANVISLGAMVALTEIVPLETLTRTVVARAPRGSEEVNTLALEVGFREGLQLRQQEKYSRIPASPMRAWRESLASCGGVEN